MENYSKEVKDIADFTDLATDIYNGINLINNRKSIPMYIYNQLGYVEINESFVKNEKDIIKYVNDIKKKYSIYMNMASFFQPNIRWDLIENCVELLQKIQYAKIVGKSIEEISKRKEDLL